MKKLFILIVIILGLSSCEKEEPPCNCYLESLLIEEFSKGELISSKLPDDIKSYSACDYDNSDKIVTSEKHSKGYTVTTYVKKCY